MPAPLPQTPSTASPADARWQRLTWTLWVVVAAVLVAGTLPLPGTRQSVLNAYAAGAQRWQSGQPLYDETSSHGFLYLPAFAVLYAPFAALPYDAGGALWRLTNLALLGVGVHLFARAVGGPRRHLFAAVLSAVALGVSWSSARHGQSTLAMAGAVLAAAGALAERRPGAAAAWCAIGLALKPLGLVPLLLVGAAYPATRLRLLLGVALVLGLPFLTQAPAYAAEQLHGFVRMLTRAGSPADRERFPDLFRALASTGVTVPEGVALALRAVAGVGALAAFVAVRRRANAPVSALWLYLLTACYLLWFNPRTEHNTFSLAGPALGAFAAWAVLQGRRGWAALHGVLALAIWFDHDLTTSITRGPPVAFTKPLLLGVFVVAAWAQSRCLGWRLETERR